MPTTSGKRRAESPAPSFVGLKPVSDASSRVKQANTKRNTKPEMLLRRALWAAGLRYRIHASRLPGNPDIVFGPTRVAVFCDGDFWHGRDWPKLKIKLDKGHNSRYWVAKIQRNIERDQAQKIALEAEGWLVLRFWEREILQNVQNVANVVLAAVCERRSARPKASAVS